MKKIIYLIIFIFISTNNVFASENITWISNKDLKEWNITIDNIPGVIVNATNFFIAIAGTISVIFIIIWWYKYLFGSLEWNTDKWKDTIFVAIIGFIIASCAYLIIKFIVDNFVWK